MWDCGNMRMRKCESEEMREWLSLALPHFLIFPIPHFRNPIFPHSHIPTLHSPAPRQKNRPRFPEGGLSISWHVSFQPLQNDFWGLPIVFHRLYSSPDFFRRRERDRTASADAREFLLGQFDDVVQILVHRSVPFVRGL